MTEPEREDKDQLWSEATLWFARMRSPEAETFRPEFEEWLGRGALHRRYYNRAAEYWVDSGTALIEGDVQHGAHERQETGPKPRKRRWASAALAVASIFVAGSTILVIADHRVHSSGAPVVRARAPLASSRFATTAGEQRRVRLTDGSVVTLGSDTILRAQLGAAIRRLELDGGKALFEVAHEARPFVVFAGGGSVTAHGTVFEVGVTPSRRVSVRLIKGSVDVSLPTMARAGVQSPSRRLRPGETVSFDGTVAQPTDRPTSSPTTTDRAAARDYRDERLADIVGEANRHAALPIRFADPSVGARTVSGRFRTDDTGLLAERIGALFDLVVDRSDPSAIVLRPK